MKPTELIASNVTAIIRMEAASSESAKAFFKAYTQVSPKIKKAKSKEALALLEKATDAMNALSKALGARPSKKKTGTKHKGFANLKHAPKKDRVSSKEE